jgi:hypothetical protein
MSRGPGRIERAYRPTDGQCAALATLSPVSQTSDIWRRFVEFGLSRGGRPRKIGHAARPVSGPVTLRELGFSKGEIAQARKLADIPSADFEELLTLFRRERRLPTPSAILRIWYQRPRRARPASLERMATLLRDAGWTVIPPNSAA